MSKRIFLIVLDSFGIGELPDAKNFGDEGSNTLLAILSSKNFVTPNLKKMGLFNIDGVKNIVPPNYLVGKPTGAYGRMIEKSIGKDTTTGHWEISGIKSKNQLPTYPQEFP